MDVAKAIALAEATGQRGNWAEVTPSSVLLLPFGQSTGAVADVMGVAYDPKADTVTLELDIVHNPHTISEFQPHAKQTLKVDEAHYHFDTAPGVKVDAQALLDNLKASNFALEGAHLFIKGKGQCENCEEPNCFLTTLTTDVESASVGENVTVSFTITGAAPECTCDTSPCSRQACCYATQDPECCYSEFGCLGCTGECSADPCANKNFVTCCNAYDWFSVSCCNSFADCQQCAAKQQAPGATGKHWAQPRSQDTAGALAAEPAAGGARSPTKGAAPTKSKQTRKKGTHKSPGTGSKKREITFSGLFVVLNIVGNAEWYLPEQPVPIRAGAKAPAGKKLPAKQDPPSFLATQGFTDEAGSLQATLQVTGPGPIIILVSYIQVGRSLFPSAVIVNAGGQVASVPVAKLALVPKLAHRHVHEPIQLTAIAQDASNSPVVGASVAFKVYGDCEPTADVSSATTGAGGVAHVTVVCSRPGEAWVVAAGVDAAGAPVLSEPAHILYKPEYDYYPGEGHEGYYHDHGYDRDHKDPHPYQADGTTQ